MSEATPAAPAPAVTWRVRVVRRVAGALGAAVVIAGIGPAIANAAGADVPNPVAVALRASGRGLQNAFGASTGTATVCEPSSSPVETTAAPSVEPSAEPSESLEPSASVEPSVEPSADPSATVVVPPPAETASPEAPEPCESESPSASPTPSPEVTESEEPDEDGTHGQIVSTVAQCAPKGKDPLLDVEGAPSNHGGYVRVAAHGDTLTTPWGSFDLSTQAGADELCATLAAVRETLPDDAEAKGKKDKERDKATKDKAKKSKKHGNG